ncbi:MAG TPA: 30S ribosomal protein S16 [Candidatus Kapabacteria bacterium]|nr:30S ribosomal protein S16 [Candidatus Kapabacteria bacterium]
MVKLRLRRKGKAHYPVYDVVAVDSRKKRDSDFIERLGYYNPNTSPTTININPDRAIYWLNVGAQPSDVVRSLLSYEGILLKRTLQFKGKTEEEIASEVEKHKVTVLARYRRRKDLRKKREAAKAKQEEKAAE